MVRFYKEGIMKNIVPLMLCISIVASCMYVYSRKYLALFVLITILIQTSVFSFYSYISRKSLILRFISIIGSFFAIGAMVAIAVKTGNNKSSIDYFIWFLQPQALVDFSMPYIAATFIIINFFIASTVYYFSAVRYRISMTFLITLIPFAVYRKEGDQVPVFFALLLLVMYMALMIHCRQINLKPRQKMIIDRGYKRSMIVFLAVSSLLALAVPKPQIKVDNTWVDTVFESDKITEYMLKRLGIASETASSSIAYTGSSNIKLFEFYAEEEPINLKSQTYSLYDFEANQWKAMKSEVTGTDITESYAGTLDPSQFYMAVSRAASLDSTFAEKYDISNIAPALSGMYDRNLYLISSRVPSKIFYVPVLAHTVKYMYGTNILTNENVLRSPQGMLSSLRGIPQTGYQISYYSDSSAYEKNMRRVMNSLDNSKFGEFLEDLQSVLDENEQTDFQYILDAYTDDFAEAMDYYELTETYMPDSIYEITKKAIGKKTSDIEKAEAIEAYFNLHDFVYSLSYKKPEGYNMEYFLTEGKTGICSDYATAMVIMARAAGIPARYAEGIHLHDPNENGVISVSDSDLHAFPELYISGYGWKSFEPTQLGAAETGSSFDLRMSLLLALTAVLIIIFILFYDRFIFPYVSEKIFGIRLKNAGNEKALEMIFIRLRKQLGLEKSVTTSEMARYISDVYNTDIQSTAENFDRVIYGGQTADDNAKSEASAIYAQIKELVAGEKKKRKMRKS